MARDLEAHRKAGEVQQVAGKIIATDGERQHWDGSDLLTGLEEEIADVIAACQFVRDLNRLDGDRIARRVFEKYERFIAWHHAQNGRGDWRR